MLHFIDHQFFLVSHTVGEHVLVLIQAFYSVGFKMDAAGNVLDVLHVCPRGRRRDDETEFMLHVGDRTKHSLIVECQYGRGTAPQIKGTA